MGGIQVGGAAWNANHRAGVLNQERGRGFRMSDRTDSKQWKTRLEVRVGAGAGQSSRCESVVGGWAVDSIIDGKGAVM